MRRCGRSELRRPFYGTAKPEEETVHGAKALGGRYAGFREPQSQRAEGHTGGAGGLPKPKGLEILEP